MVLRGLLLALLVVSLVGCRGKINSSSFSRIKRGMQLQEVEATLGAGVSLSDEEILEQLKKSFENAPEELRKNAEKMTLKDVQNLTARRWKEGRRTITVLFRDERVQQATKEGF